MNTMTEKMTKNWWLAIAPSNDEEQYHLDWGQNGEIYKKKISVLAARNLRHKFFVATSDLIWVDSVPLALRWFKANGIAAHYDGWNSVFIKVNGIEIELNDSEVMWRATLQQETERKRIED
jgi:hypothetical protein